MKLLDRAPRVAHTILPLAWEQCITFLCSKGVFHQKWTILAVRIFELRLPHYEIKEILFRLLRDIADTTCVIHLSCRIGAKLVLTIPFFKQIILVVSGVVNIKKDEITSLSILWPYATVLERLITTLVPDPRRGVLCLLAQVRILCNFIYQDVYERTHTRNARKVNLIFFKDMT